MIYERMKIREKFYYVKRKGEKKEFSKQRKKNKS